MLGYRLRNLRTDKKLSQADIAKHLSISRQAYNFYETGKREPSNDMLRKIADFFDVSVDNLLGRDLNVINSEPQDEKQVELNEKDMKQIKIKAEQMKDVMMGAVGLAFDGNLEDADDETLELVMQALEEGLILAKKEAKKKFTPKKYKK